MRDMNTIRSRQAFVLRISPGGTDLVPEAIEQNQIIIGWGVSGLLEPNLNWEQFRSIVSDHFYAQEPNLRRAGGASGQLWRFINDMSDGDLVVVPYNSDFYVLREYLMHDI